MLVHCRVAFRVVAVRVTPAMCKMVMCAHTGSRPQTTPMFHHFVWKGTPGNLHHYTLLIDLTVAIGIGNRHRGA